VTEPAWTTDELDRIGAAEELEIAARRRDGTLRPTVPIWVVRVEPMIAPPARATTLKLVPRGVRTAR